jgi:hypothetical protein
MEEVTGYAGIIDGDGRGDKQRELCNTLHANYGAIGSEVHLRQVD